MITDEMLAEVRAVSERNRRTGALRDNPELRVTLDGLAVYCRSLSRQCKDERLYELSESLDECAKSIFHALEER